MATLMNIRSGSTKATGAVRFPGGWALLIALGSIAFSVQAQTATDACSFGAGSQYTVNASCVPQSFDLNNGFGQDLSPATCGAGLRDDGFGWFTATATTTNLTYTASNNNHDPTLHIYTASSCGSLGTPVCVNASGTNTETYSFATVVGQSYLIRVQRNGSNNAMAGDLCVWNPPPPPANDDPCAAVPLSVGTACTNTSATNVSATATAGIPAPGCGSYSTGDVWFSFTAPASGRITLETTAGSLTDAGLAIYSAASCSGPFTLVECDDNDGTGSMSAIQRTGLTPGLTYYVRVWGAGGATGTFSICAWDNPPVNDDPCAAVPLTAGATCTGTAGTNVGAYSTGGAPAPTCGTYTYSDVWYTFVAPASGHVNLTTFAGSLSDAAMAVYTASSCSGPFTQLACNDNANGGNMPGLDLTGLTAAQTYYVRVWGNGELTGTFSICAFDMPGDAPCTAAALPVNASCVNSASTNVGASRSGTAAPSCGTYGAASADIWFTVVAPASGMIAINTSAGTLTDGVMAVYSAPNCNGAMTELACNNNGTGMPALNLTGLTSGQTYYVRFWGNGSLTGTFSICAYDPSLPNDEPCGATVITPGSACVMGTYTNVGATFSASANIPAPGCGNLGTSTLDVWFRFTAPPSGFISISTQAGSLTNAAMALYAGSCSGALTLLDCDANDGAANMPFLSFSDLVGGNTYYLRVWGESTASGTFGLCLMQPPTTGNCFYALNMFDAAGDGWGGSTVGISINGGAYTTYTLATGEHGVVYIPITTGQTVSVQYTAAGGWQNEISYTLQLGAGALYSAGPTPATGVVYTGVANCIAPAALASDCQGGSTVCNAQTINGSPNNTGLVADLTVQSRGCLSANERQGLWYNFSPSSSGTVAFTISPSNAADDYDFAVWGPLPSLDCVDKGAPLRCSYSGLSGNTGLLAGAGDNSEGAGGDKWVNPITVAAGQVYILYVSNYSQSGLAFNLTWQLSGGASLDCTVLPIELLWFDAAAHGSQVDLTWATATELHSDRFEVERSADLDSWSTIGSISAMGMSNQYTDYRFVDEAPLAGTGYYRLRAWDLDGTWSLSDVRSVRFDAGAAALAVSPNPASGKTIARFHALADGEILFQLIDMHGKLVRSLPARANTGPNTIEVPLEGLNPGTYILRLLGPVAEGSQATRVLVE